MMVADWRTLGAFLAVLSVACATVTPESPPGTAATARVPVEPYYEYEVDIPARILRRVTPGYPDSLRQRGVRGRVEMEYVVDTLGRVEPPTVRLVRGRALPAGGVQLLAATAREAILATPHSPARRQGRPVRQIIQHVFEFELPSRSPAGTHAPAT